MPRKNDIINIVNTSLKRLFDLSFSLASLTLLSPVFFVVAILIKRDSPGPVFFVQKRVGKNFRPFNLYKFRTMPSDLPSGRQAATIGADPNATGTGRFLRKFRLDELPQLINVFKGDMSFVGPGAESEEHVNIYRKDFEQILRVRPGMTDAFSIIFNDESSRLEEKENPEEYYLHVLLPEKIKLAKEYSRSSTAFGDMGLIIRRLFTLCYPQKTILNMMESSGRMRRALVIAIELSIFSLSNYLAFYIRFDGSIPEADLYRFFSFLPLLLIIRLFLVFAFSLQKGLWRYVSYKDIVKIIQAVSIGSLIFLVCVRYLYGEISYPRSVYAIDWLLNIFLLISIRYTRRIHEKGAGHNILKKRVLVIGAGDSANILIRDTEQSTVHPYNIVGLVDDDPNKKGLSIHGIPILGNRGDLERIASSVAPDEFIIAIPSAPAPIIEEITLQLRGFGLPIKILPGLFGLLSGGDSFNQMKEVSPEDILFRAPADHEIEELRGYFHSRRILVTGAGGSIGSELTRLLASLSPERLILFERHEENLYNIDKELRLSYDAHDSFIHPVIGDITDAGRVTEIMELHKPDIVFHAAAYKHVPLMEYNPAEAFKTNILGTRLLARAANDFGVERFIFISTDKAVNPTNIMGMTKKMAERVILKLSAEDKTGTKHMIVRFGNVLGSSGSVVPHFIEQIKRGGPVTVTDPAITRYFMTIPEAVKLVAHAVIMGEGKEIFVLDMGNPIKIVDLARRLISLFGYSVGKEIDIKFIGLRPGEKMHEELYNSYEAIEKTAHPKINKAISNMPDDHEIFKTIDALEHPGILNDKNVKEHLNALIKGVTEGRDDLTCNQ